MNEKELLGYVSDEVSYYRNTSLSVNPPFARTQSEVLDLIEKYSNSQYRDGDSDNLGQKKTFYNIVNFPVDVASKMIDFDTKDIMLLDETGSYWETWIMEKELRFWLRDNLFGRQLNEYCYYLPRDGHLVVKKVGDEIIRVPLKNLRFRPDATSLKNIPIIEKHEYMWDEFKNEAQQRNWDNWRKVKRIASSSPFYGDTNQKKDVTVYEAYFPKGFLGSGYNYFLISHDGKVLAYFEEDNPYKDLAWEEVEGRAIGRGQIEKLFEEQIYLNRLANAKAEGLYWTSKHIYQTRDTSMNTNLMTLVDNGDVLLVNDLLQPVPTEERNLGFYNYDEQRWEQNANRRAVVTEPITGERSPAGTPLGSTILQARMSTNYYDQKRENIALFLKDILWDWVIPTFKNQKREEHKVLVDSLLTGEEGSDKLFKMLVDNEMNKELVKKYLPSDAREFKRAFIADKVKNSKLTIPKGVYDNLKYKMRINIVGEGIDTNTKMTTLWQLFQVMASNPAVLQDKRTRNILNKALTMSGFNPKDFNFDEEVMTPQEAVSNMKVERGGSIAAPPAPSTPTAMPTEITV